jgi:hypothetical protein
MLSSLDYDRRFQRCRQHTATREYFGAYGGMTRDFLRMSDKHDRLAEKAMPVLVRCQQCGRVTGTTTKEIVSGLDPCTWCGSSERTYECDEHGFLRGYNRFTSRKVGADGKKTKTLETRAGDHWHHKSAQWRKEQRRIDHEHDHYSKVITDAITGEERYKDEGKLSDHQGHGDAKRKASRKPRLEHNADD